MLPISALVAIIRGCTRLWPVVTGIAILAGLMPLSARRVDITVNVGLATRLMPLDLFSLTLSLHAVSLLLQTAVLSSFSLLLQDAARLKVNCAYRFWSVDNKVLFTDMLVASFSVCVRIAAMIPLLAVVRSIRRL